MVLSVSVWCYRKIITRDDWLLTRDVLAHLTYPEGIRQMTSSIENNLLPTYFSYCVLVSKTPMSQSSDTSHMCRLVYSRHHWWCSSSTTLGGAIIALDCVWMMCAAQLFHFPPPQLTSPERWEGSGELLLVIFLEHHTTPLGWQRAWFQGMLPSFSFVSFPFS